MSVLAQIRAATAPLHEGLETKSRIVERLSCPAGRPAILYALLRLYEPAEAALAPRMLAIPELEFARRRKAGALRAGLRRLGQAMPAGPDDGSARRPVFAGSGEALGFAYVLEGASLGGRIVRRQVVRRGAPLDGMDFFDFYGPDTGRRWQQFCHVLERECAGDPGSAVAGACTGFGYMAAGLLPAPRAPAGRSAAATG